MYTSSNEYVNGNDYVEKNFGLELNPKAYKPLGKQDDPYEIYTSDLKYGVYADGELVYKSKLKRDAKATIEEWKEIDAEVNESHSYIIKKLVDKRLSHKTNTKE